MSSDLWSFIEHLRQDYDISIMSDLRRRDPADILALYAAFTDAVDVLLKAAGTSLGCMAVVGDGPRMQAAEVVSGGLRLYESVLANPRRLLAVTPTGAGERAQGVLSEAYESVTGMELDAGTVDELAAVERQAEAAWFSFVGTAQSRDGRIPRGYAPAMRHWSLWVSQSGVWKQAWADTGLPGIFFAVYFGEDGLPKKPAVGDAYSRRTRLAINLDMKSPHNIYGKPRTDTTKIARRWAAEDLNIALGHVRNKYLSGVEVPLIDVETV